MIKKKILYETLQYEVYVTTSHFRYFDIEMHNFQEEILKVRTNTSILNYEDYMTPVRQS